MTYVSVSSENSWTDSWWWEMTQTCLGFDSFPLLLYEALYDFLYFLSWRMSLIKAWKVRLSTCSPVRLFSSRNRLMESRGGSAMLRLKLVSLIPSSSRTHAEMTCRAHSRIQLFDNIYMFTVCNLFLMRWSHWQPQVICPEGNQDGLNMQKGSEAKTNLRK